MDKKNTFETKIKPILQYVGAIGATLMSIMYIVVIVILIIGFKAQTFQQALIFALVNAVVGLIIMQFLKIQGIAFAENIPENKAIKDEYYRTRTRDKKYESINSYWVKSIIQDII